MISWYVVT